MKCMRDKYTDFVSQQLQAKMAPDSVAMCHAPVEDPWTGEQVRQDLLATITGLPI